VSNPLGGVIFFNSSDAVLFYGDGNVHNFLNLGMLPSGVGKINDIAVLHDGRTSAATDYGLVLLYGGVVVDHVTRYDGIAENNIKKVFPDSLGRVWFSTKKTVGYYYSPVYTRFSSAEFVPFRETGGMSPAASEDMGDSPVSSDESYSGNMPGSSDLYSDKSFIDVIIGILWPF
jgi:hypothetical protein